MQGRLISLLLHTEFCTFASMQIPYCERSAIFCHVLYIIKIKNFELSKY